ncbi:MAG: lysine--tRNA ligase [Candidatus Hydrogenedentota bacterium]
MSGNSPEEHRGELEVRRAKRDKLAAAGIEPYPCRFDRVDTARGITSSFHDDAPSKNAVTAGRIRSIRGHGKACFMTIEDESGTVQIHLKKDVLGERYGIVAALDLGDFIGVSGPVFRTRMGEITVEARELRFLCKALEPLPSKWHGLADVEIRYRRRYLDMISNPEVRGLFQKRARIIAEIRSYLSQLGFMEVETPMMQTLAGGASARPFITHHNTLDIDLFLRIAPELYLKRLIVGGLEKVYELNRNFRNEGMDRNHNPEFTMLELYQAYSDYHGMMDLTESLIAHVADRESEGVAIVPGSDPVQKLSLAKPWKRITFLDAIAAGGGPRLVPGDAASALQAAKAAHCELATEDYAECLDVLFGRFAESIIVEPTFVIDYPVALSPLAKRKPGEPELTERFELYVAGMEIANAFSELNDPDDQEARFRSQGGTVDMDYVEALRIGMPPTGGLGIGIDRLVMLLTGARTIRDVIFFPTMRPHEKDEG